MLGIALLAAPMARGQSIPATGRDATLDVATWNLYWWSHPSNGPADDEQQFVRVRETIRQSDIDLWALQEVSNTEAFSRLMEELGSDFSGELADISTQQRLAFVYRNNVIRPRGFTAIRHILTNQSAAFAGRPPLLFDASVTVADTTFDVVFITVHMKAYSDIESYEQRRSAATALKNYLDFLMPKDAVFVLGDFNDRLSGSITGGKKTPYLNFTSDPARYRFVSEPLDRSNTPTWCANLACSAGTPLDHILITNELFSLYEEDSCTRMVDLLQALPGFVSNTSDHLPVVAHFDPSLVATDAQDRPPPAAQTGPVVAYPSPFRQTLLIAFDAPPLKVTVTDALGRRLLQVVPTHSPWLLDTSAWRPGPYFLEVMRNGLTQVIPVVRAG